MKLTLAYDGGAFAGWQSQSNGNGVQDHLETALGAVLSVRPRVHGAGRTDAGVHATGQVAHVEMPDRNWTEATWLAALNGNLPRQIRVLTCQRVSQNFHARFSAVGKCYRYRIWRASFLHPLEIGRAWHVPPETSFDRLKAAAPLFLGTHDFTSFSANRRTPVGTSIRTLSRLQVRKKGALITLDYTGDGFLYRMVRLITGSMVRVALGKANESWLETLLQPGNRQKSNYLAPAEGLYLQRVIYAPKTRFRDTLKNDPTRDEFGSE